MGNLIQRGLHEECIKMVDTFDEILEFVTQKQAE